MRIHPSIEHLAVPVKTLVPLENNPRKGDLGAIIASYRQFGQVKPIVVKTNGDGTSTVIAGNHQLQAAKQMGWTEIAVVELDGDDQEAIAFALADNRTAELGFTDNSLVLELIQEIPEYTQLLEDLQWDEFEIAAITEWTEKNDPEEEDERGYVAPVMVEQPRLDSAVVKTSKNEDGETVLTATEDVDTQDAVTRGSGAINSGGGGSAVVQYTLVFDDADQQKDWYSFIRYLKSSPVYEGDTTAERLMNFVQSHADY
jgi:hypothetical protein